MTRHKIILGFPGPSLTFRAARALFCASQNHDIEISQSNLAAWDGFNQVWCDGLNAFAAGEATHFAMLHSDIRAEPGWLDVLMEELERTGADLVSAIVPIKDGRGVVSAGIGDPCDSWSPWRRFTMKEVMQWPETFGAAEAGYPGWPLLVNTAMWVCDLRRPLFHTVDEDGFFKCQFAFPVAIGKFDDGKARSLRESEDWYFSRQIHALGAKVLCTRKVPLYHEGNFSFPNFEPWGKYETDQDSRKKWANAEALRERAEALQSSDFRLQIAD